jgi:hypothetical protein
VVIPVVRKKPRRWTAIDLLSSKLSRIRFGRYFATGFHGKQSG